MIHVLAALAGAAVVATMSLTRVGFHPIPPFGFVLSLTLLLPLAWVVAGLTSRLESHLDRRVVPLVGGLIAIGLIAGTRLSPLPAALVALGVGFVLRPPSPGRHLPLALLAVCCGYLALWNANYVALWVVRGRLADPALRASDVAVYSALTGATVDYRGLFPLVDHPLALALLQGAYLLFFLELAVLICLLDESRLTRHLVRLFGCYGVALACFLVWPVAGPCLAYPESVRDVWAGSAVGTLMRVSEGEFAAILAGTQPPTTTMGYFVGLPSLHAAAAVLCQAALRPYRLAWWSFWPVNILMTIATVALGFHYLADTVAGLLLGLVAVRVVRSA